MYRAVGFRKAGICQTEFDERMGVSQCAISRLWKLVVSSSNIQDVDLVQVQLKRELSRGLQRVNNLITGRETLRNRFYKGSIFSRRPRKYSRDSFSTSNLMFNRKQILFYEIICMPAKSVQSGDVP